MAKKKAAGRKKATKKSAVKTPKTAHVAITKKSALAYLRKVEAQLYLKKTEAAVAKLAFKQRMDFFRERLAFTALIGRLNAELMRDIGADLQAQARSLKQGIDNTAASLTKLENAAKWAKAINTVTSSIGKVVKLF